MQNSWVMLRRDGNKRILIGASLFAATMTIYGLWHPETTSTVLHGIVAMVARIGSHIGDITGLLSEMARDIGGRLH